MKIRRQARAVSNYFASGVACGLGGMLLAGVPSLAITMALLNGRDFLVRNGLPVPDEFGWVSRGSILIGMPLEPIVAFVGVIGVPALGFLFGWWMGMHRGEHTSQRSQSPAGCS